MPDFEEKVLERSDLTALIETSTKPVLDLLEASVLRALGVVTKTIDEGLTEEEVLHAEASIYEEVIRTCLARSIQIAGELKDKGDEARGGLLALSLWEVVCELGLPGEVDVAEEDKENPSEG